MHLVSVSSCLHGTDGHNWWLTIDKTRLSDAGLHSHVALRRKKTTWCFKQSIKSFPMYGSRKHAPLWLQKHTQLFPRFGLSCLNLFRQDKPTCLLEAEWISSNFEHLIYHSKNTALLKLLNTWERTIFFKTNETLSVCLLFGISHYIRELFFFSKGK